MNRCFSLQDNNLPNDKFCEMLDTCLNNCGYFTLTSPSNINSSSFIETIRKEKGDDISVVALKPQLKKFLIKDFNTKNWYCYNTFDESNYFFLNVSIYTLNDTTKAKIKDMFFNLFLCDDGVNQIYLDEDICFFEDGKLLLGTVSHAHICNIYPNSEEQLLSFKKIADWKEMPYHRFEHLRLSCLFDFNDDCSPQEIAKRGFTK